MHFFGSTLAAATFLFIGSIVALPTTNNAAISLSDALEILGDHSNLAKRVMIASTRRSTKGIQQPLCKLDTVSVPIGDGMDKLL